MATMCSYCGYRSNEVKSGSGVSETGTRITLRIANVSDLNRDVILVSIHNMYICSDLITIVFQIIDLLIGHEKPYVHMPELFKELDGLLGHVLQTKWHTMSETKGSEVCETLHEHSS